MTYICPPTNIYSSKFYDYILSLFKNVVNNDTAKGWTTIFSQFNNDVSPISSDFADHIIDINVGGAEPANVALQSHWNVFPKGMSFIGQFSTGERIDIMGYIYPDGDYGSIFWHKCDGSSGLLHRYASTFHEKSILTNADLKYKLIPDLGGADVCTLHAGRWCVGNAAANGEIGSWYVEVIVYDDSYRTVHAYPYISAKKYYYFAKMDRGVWQGWEKYISAV